MPRGKTARILALTGDLGSGKTTFVQGALRALGVKGAITSPTFVLMKHYRAPKYGLEIYHLDAYRLKSEEDLAVLDFAEKIKNPNAVIIVEWPERIKKAMRSGVRKIKLSHEKKAGSRTIKIY